MVVACPTIIAAYLSCMYSTPSLPTKPNFAGSGGINSPMSTMFRNSLHVYNLEQDVDVVQAGSLR